MRNSLQKEFNGEEWWIAKELSAFLKKHEIVRGWKTILSDLKRGVRMYAVNRICGYVALSEKTAKKYIRYILEDKKKNIESTNKVNEIVCDLNLETKRTLKY